MSEVKVTSTPEKQNPNAQDQDSENKDQRQKPQTPEGKGLTNDNYGKSDSDAPKVNKP